jgi:hypothetical protein
MQQTYTKMPEEYWLVFDNWQGFLGNASPPFLFFILSFNLGLF